VSAWDRRAAIVCLAGCVQGEPEAREKRARRMEGGPRAAGRPCGCRSSWPHGIEPDAMGL
jgi:hypothetical protein